MPTTLSPILSLYCLSLSLSENKKKIVTTQREGVLKFSDTV